MPDDAEELPIVDHFARLFYRERPAMTFGPLAEAWAREGYECREEDFSAREGVRCGGFRGGTLVMIDEPTPIEQVPLPSHTAEAAALPFDFSRTFIVDPRPALEDYRACKYAVRVRLRAPQQPDRTITHNDFAAALLGIDQAFRFDAAWLEGPELLAGRAALDENLGYANSKDGKPQAATPLMFSTNLRQEGERVIGWTRGLAFFDHPELYLEADPGRLDDVASALFNGALYVMGGAALEAGESISSGPTTCAIGAGSFGGEPALKLRLV